MIPTGIRTPRRMAEANAMPTRNSPTRKIGEMYSSHPAIRAGQSIARSATT